MVDRARFRANRLYGLLADKERCFLEAACRRAELIVARLARGPRTKPRRMTNDPGTG